MADRSLRGMRLGAQSLQSDEGVTFVDHKHCTYETSDGERFRVTFAADADAPHEWESPRSGKVGRLLDEDGKLVPPDEHNEKPQRTHWDMLLERRSEEELEQILKERLQYLRERRGTATKA